MNFIKRLSTLALSLCVLLISATACADTFADVDSGAWYSDDVEAMAENGYLTGYEDGTFRPEGTITKAELVSVVCRITGTEASESANSHWADGFIQAALNAGFFDWDEIPPDGTTYDEPITRQLAVKIVMNAFLPDEAGDYNTVYSEVSDFSDLDGRYYESMFAAYCSGVVNGDEYSRLNPKSTITRAEACAVIMRAVGISGGEYGAYTPAATPEPQAEKTYISGGVSDNGWLSVSGTQLVNENGESVILSGMSSHGLQWYPQFTSEAAIRSTAEYGANVFRCAMYTAEGGYLSDASVKSTLISAVDTAIACDMYVIIDWHILSDGDPMTSIDAAAEFFAEMSARYADEPAVIYEICNEPNGSITWSGNVKPYAERIISVIRENSRGIILVGSPTWSQDLHEAAADPLDAENIMYTCHFYAGTHTEWLRERIASCGLPVFVSEWGTSAADGSGGVYLDEAQKWIDFMNENGISRVNWSLCDKNETSAAVVSGADISDGIAWDELTESGKFVFANF
ncbi:MAG: cellulase family glycosylhydrolase [Firmicutes bacterium]|nr:cellulase family glycosylhydrolase [Bacillota bacterium]